MAAITSSNVTVIHAYRLGDIGNKYQGVLKRLAIVLSAQGGTAADIPASVLGFSRMDSVSAAVLDVSGTPKGAWVGLSTDGLEIITFNANQAADANRTARADITGTLYVTVIGLAT
jgi:hypothetical protein